MRRTPTVPSTQRPSSSSTASRMRATVPDGGADVVARRPRSPARSARRRTPGRRRGSAGSSRGSGARTRAAAGTRSGTAPSRAGTSAAQPPTGAFGPTTSSGGPSGIHHEREAELLLEGDVVLGDALASRRRVLDVGERQRRARERVDEPGERRDLVERAGLRPHAPGHGRVEEPPVERAVLAGDRRARRPRRPWGHRLVEQACIERARLAGSRRRARTRRPASCRPPAARARPAGPGRRPRRRPCVPRSPVAHGRAPWPSSSAVWLSLSREHLGDDVAHRRRRRRPRPRAASAARSPSPGSPTTSTPRASSSGGRAARRRARPGRRPAPRRAPACRGSGEGREPVVDRERAQRPALVLVDVPLRAMRRGSGPRRSATRRRPRRPSPGVTPAATTASASASKSVRIWGWWRKCSAYAVVASSGSPPPTSHRSPSTAPSCGAVCGDDLGRERRVRAEHLERGHRGHAASRVTRAPAAGRGCGCRAPRPRT